MILSKNKAAKSHALPIAKLNGAGNDFLIIDWRDSGSRTGFKKYFGGSSRGQAAKTLCHPHFSIGADGLLFLENSKVADLKWDFYNADGSRAEMCGNAARTIGLFSQQDVLTLETRAGVVTISRENKNDIFRVEMPEIKAFEPLLPVSKKKSAGLFDFVNSGVPHSVLHIPRIRNIRGLEEYVHNLVDIVEKIRALSRFRKSGTNVTFYSTSDGREPAKSKSSSISSLTFERGVAGYTLACGTGVVAAAYSFANKRSVVTKLVNVRVPGGNLQIDLQRARPQLVGPAKFVAEILYYEP